MQFFQILSQVPLQQCFLHVLIVFTPLSMPQFMISPFPLKIGITTLVAQSAGNPFPSSILWQSPINTSNVLND